MRLSGKTGPYAPKHLKLKFEEFDYGFLYKRVREDGDEKNPHWTVGRVGAVAERFYLGNHFWNGACRSTTRIRSASLVFMRVRRDASLTCRRRCRPG